MKGDMYMTPKEAVAQALVAAKVPAGVEGPWRNAVRSDTDAIAAAILAVLPEGWALVEAKSYETDLLEWAAAAGEVVGAQQEREWLRAEWNKVPRWRLSKYTVVRADAIDALLADPEDDR